MLPNQKKFYKNGFTAINTRLKNGVLINAEEIIDLLNMTIANSGTVKTVQWDAGSLEITGSTTEKFLVANALAADLGGRICAPAAFANAALKAGVRIEKMRPTMSSVKAAQVLALNRDG